MPGISKKILLLAGEKSVKSWAESHGLPPSTVHEWVKHDRMPRDLQLKELVTLTGRPLSWWKDKSDCIPSDDAKTHSHDNKNISASSKREVLQYDSIKEYQQVVVNLNAKQKRWLEAICSNFAALDDEQEQQKIFIYSTDLYDKKVNTNKKQPEFVSGIVERTMENTPHDRRSKIKKFRKSKNTRASKLSKR